MYVFSGKKWKKKTHVICHFLRKFKQFQEFSQILLGLVGLFSLMAHLFYTLLCVLQFGVNHKKIFSILFYFFAFLSLPIFLKSVMDHKHISKTNVVKCYSAFSH